MARVSNTIPSVGEIIEWDIDEILERTSSDLNYYDVRKCSDCGTLFSVEVDWYPCGCHEEPETEAESYWDNFEDYYPKASIAESWEFVLDLKREDDHFEELKSYIEEVGFIRPCTASAERWGDDYLLRFCDGHHRLAIALDMGLKTITVEVMATMRSGIAEDSGSWTREDEELNN